MDRGRPLRIGIDLLGIQSPESRGRGIGRYGRGLLDALLTVGVEHEFLLYGHHGLPVEDVPVAPNAWLRELLPARNAGESVARLAIANADQLDALLILSPFELHRGYNPPARPVDGLPLAAVVYDLIPFLFQERYLTYPPSASRFYRNLERLRSYDALLGISEATARDARRLLGLSNERVVAIGAASDPDFFIPDRVHPVPERSRRILDSLGIDGPFVFCLGSTDERKNLDGLLDGFALLPAELRLTHRLVLTCALTGPEADAVRRQSEARGLADRVVLTGQINDEMLRVLYQRCAAFAFPSHYEGFGLPILEAMHCGAPVIAGNNSAQVEVAGDGALLANTNDAADIASAISRILGDPAFAREIGERGRSRAASYRWADVGRRALDALERAARFHRGPDSARVRSHPPQEPQRPRLRRQRPRLAFVAPLPPMATGIADYSIRLLRELRELYSIDLYHEHGYEPDLGSEAGFYGCFDHKLFARRSRELGYRGVVYQMGNSYYHGYLYELLQTFPGIVTLHDVNLSGFHFWRAHQGGREPFAYFRAELEDLEPELAHTVIPWLREMAAEPGGLERAFTRRGLLMNRAVIGRSQAVMVHSTWAAERLRKANPSHADRIEVAPLGATPSPPTLQRRAAVRARYELPAEALIIASFGILHSQKMNIESLDAFAVVAKRVPSALFLFVGPDHASGSARFHAQSLGLTDRVRFLGRQSTNDFEDLLAVADLGINLRRPPTNGETSAALLDLLRHGVPTIVTDVDAFSDFPDSVVRKLRWDANGPAELERAMLELALDSAARSRYGEAALSYIVSLHAWPRAAARYAEVIERVATERVSCIA